MIYKILDMIYFRSDDGLVWLDNQTSITLTATTSRLLKYLLDHREHVVYRDEILEKVWDAHGLRTSSHSLNKYVSDLRAVFRNMGCAEEVIITVPRIGFMISESIIIEQVNAVKSDECIAITENNVQRGLTTFLSILIKNKYYIVSMLLMAFVLCVGFEVGISGKIFSSGKDSVYYLGSIDTCPVMSFNIIPLEQKEELIKIAKQILAKEGMHCSNNSTFYFNISEPVMKGHEGRIFLAHCIYLSEKKNVFYSCYNYYRSDYEIIK